MVDTRSSNIGWRRGLERFADNTADVRNLWLPRPDITAEKVNIGVAVELWAGMREVMRAPSFRSGKAKFALFRDQFCRSFRNEPGASIQ